MKNLFAIVLALVCSGITSKANDSRPFKPRSVTVDYGMGRMATFTFEPSEIERRIQRELQSTREELQRERQSTLEDQRKRVFSFRSVEEPKAEKPKSGQRVRSPSDPGTKIVKVEFIFSNGRKTGVPETDIRDVDLIGIADSEIEYMGQDGSWALSIRIKNLRTIPARIADDRVVYIFENYKYRERWLEIDKKWNANK